MKSSFHFRLRTWREQRAFTCGEAVAFINSLQSGPPISAETLEQIETGINPTTTNRMLLEFFRFAAPPFTRCHGSPPLLLLFSRT
jgi:hypothetical protein